MTNASDIGLVGLAVMGENLVLNMESKGFSVSVYNRTTEVTDKFAAGRAKGKRIVSTHSVEEFVKSLARPRKMMIMVKAGPPVDAVIDQLLPYLEKGDVIIDGGNSLYTDTQRRDKALTARGFHFLGMGVSGGEEGALKGPSLMPGGSKDAWEIVAPIFQKIAAQVDGEPCCRYMGPDGGGHYVKMVHNGIEYGDMQLICEAYAILRDVLGLTAPELHNIFTEWNHGDLDSFLIEITANIFSKIDPETGKPLVDVILDKAGQKGTGRWTLQSAIEQAVVISTINAAVEARVLSAMKEQRVRASKQLSAPGKFNYPTDRQALIIRAKFLNRIKEAFDREPNLENLMLDPFFKGVLKDTQANWRTAVSLAIQAGVAVPAFSASLAYFDSYRSERLPANLLQAQRDYFGAHTYERVDKPGVFHTEWLKI